MRIHTRPEKAIYEHAAGNCLLLSTQFLRLKASVNGACECVVPHHTIGAYVITEARRGIYMYQLQALWQTYI